MPDLKRYRAKRDPDSTPEPFGEDALARALPAGASRLFVVQQHAARNMHWDLRLEIDGVLASWAIPRAPPWIRRRSAWRCAPRTTPSSTRASKA